MNDPNINEFSMQLQNLGLRDEYVRYIVSGLYQVEQLNDQMKLVNEEISRLQTMIEDLDRRLQEQEE